jgi:site-specific DNA recombinase
MEEAVGYARISQHDQSKHSLPGQVADIKSFCDRNKLILRKTFVENGQSAFTFKRKEWKDLETFLKENKQVKYLVVRDLDRFSRADLVDALAKMDEIQKRIHVKILTISDPLNLDTEDFGVQIRRVMELMFSNYELKKIRKRTSDGIYQSLSSGRYANMAPFGYNNERDVNEKAILSIDDEKAFHVRTIFRLYNSGMEMEEIRKHINANGFKMKGNSAMRRILSNPVYAGLIQVPVKGNMPARLVRAIHTPLITESEYWLAQERLIGKKVTRQKREDVFLRGVLHCWCGRKMTAGNSQNKNKKYYWYYMCGLHKKNLSAIKLHKQFYEILELLSWPPDSVEVMTAALRTKVDDSLKNKGGDLMKVKLNLSKIQDKIGAAEEKFLCQGDISQASYKKVMSELKADEQRLHEQVADLSGSGKDLYDIMDHVLPKLGNIKELFTEWPLYKQQAFVNLVFSNSLHYKDGSYRTPFIDPIFAHNVNILKEKGLLLIEQSDVFLGATPGRSEDGSVTEHLLKLYHIFAA